MKKQTNPVEKILVVLLGVGVLVLLVLTGCLAISQKQALKVGKVNKIALVEEKLYEYAEEEDYITTMDNAFYEVEEKKAEEPKADETVSDSSDYILPKSDKKYYKKKDLKGLTKKELKLARNEIYARHGRIFTTDEIREYFEGKDWYEPKVDEVSDSELNKFEIANRDLIVEYEEEKGWN